MYCIYLDEDVDKKDMNREHIIPLSLGGANGFEIQVDSQTNANMGSDVDAAIANDFFMSFPRREYDARGHSNKKPFPLAKKSKLVSSDKPVQIAFKKEKIEIYSPIDRRILDESEVAGETFQSTFKLDPYSRMRFTAKVALSAGYFIYGDLFRNNVEHNEIRMLMRFNRSTADRKEFEGFETKGWFWPFPVEEKDKNDHQLYQFFASHLESSFVLAIPGPSSLGLIVGILGQVAGIINCPAKTDDFPLGNDHDLGHLVSTKDGKVTRMSYRELAKNAAIANGLDIPES